MTPLQAAVQGARDFELWAKAQGCNTTLLTDDDLERVTVAEIFDAVEQVVNAGTYGQLIIYFSGHGILTAPGAEYWLLSRGPQNPNEAVNVSRSVVDARNSGIPHVVFVSDACRSSVTGPPLSGVTGSVIFPSRPIGLRQGEIDVYYATRPGDPAYEVPEAEATQRYRGIFTDGLLKAVKAPPDSLVETVLIGSANTGVISSRKMKEHLEATVPVDAADIDVKLRQAPQIIVETALPKYFAEVSAGSVVSTRAPAPGPLPPSPTVDRALLALFSLHLAGLEGTPPSQADTDLAEHAGLLRQVQDIVATRGRSRFETRTGFTIFGVNQVDAEAQRWRPDPPFPEAANGPGWHVRLNPQPGQDVRQPSTIVFSFDGMSGAAMAILPGFIGTLIVENGRVTSVNYVPSQGTSRYTEYEQREGELSAMKAFAAVASRNGRFVVENENPQQFAYRIRQAKGIDPTMGIYAGYAYAQAGKFQDVYSVYTFMRDDEIELPIPFDVGLLATHYKPDLNQEPRARFAPFCPMLAQGWALLGEDHPMYAPIDGELRTHLVPSLWTTLSAEGVQIARTAIRFEMV
jgi:caspase domain-containing protein